MEAKAVAGSSSKQQGSSEGPDEEKLPPTALEAGETSMADELKDAEVQETQSGKRKVSDTCFDDLVSQVAHSGGEVGGQVEGQVEGHGEPGMSAMEKMSANNQSLSHELAQSSNVSLKEMDAGADLSLMDLQTDQLMEQIHQLETELNNVRGASSVNANTVKVLEEERVELQQRVEDLEVQRTELHKKHRQVEELLREKEGDLEEARNLLKENQVSVAGKLSPNEMQMDRHSHTTCTHTNTYVLTHARI